MRFAILGACSVSFTFLDPVPTLLHYFVIRGVIRVFFPLWLLGTFSQWRVPAGDRREGREGQVA